MDTVNVIVSLIIGTAAAAHAAGVGTPYLVKNIDQVSRDSSANPRAIGSLGDTGYFGAERADDGAELWRTDGTPQGTALVRALGVDSHFGNSGDGVALNGQLFFNASTSANGIELWKTDGTASGTVMLPEANPGSGSSSPSMLVASSTRVFYAAYDGAKMQLWSTDGTAAGTGPVGAFSGSIHGLVSGMDNWVLVYGDSGTWRTDGTDAGTYKLTLDSREFPDPYTVVLGGSLLFIAGDTQFLYDKIYRTDGTTGGTSIVAFIGPGGVNSHKLTHAGDVAYYVADPNKSGYDELWKTDGTAQGTTKVAGHGSEGIGLLMGALGNKILLAGAGGIYASDGAGLSLAVPLPGMITFENDPPPIGGRGSIIVADGVLYFVMSSATGSQLWRTDGTQAGTRLVSAGALDNADLTRLRGGVFFISTEDGFPEPWASDGTSAGTRRLATIVNHADESSSPVGLTPYRGALYFFASSNGKDFDLWTTTGHDETTRRIKTFSAAFSPVPPVSFGECNGVFYFRACDQLGCPMWRSDGTAAGTFSLGAEPVTGATAACIDRGFVFPADAGAQRKLLLTDGSSASAMTTLGEYMSLTQVTKVGSRVVFYGDGVRTSDGTAAGTQPLPLSFATNLGIAGGAHVAYLYGSQTPSQQELWRTDGTAAGTSLVTTGSGISFGVVAGDTFYFRKLQNGKTGLWKTDGTPEGTALLASDLILWSGFAVYKGAVYLSASPEGGSSALYRTDGTPAGTTVAISNASDPAVAGGYLFFRGSSAGTGDEPFVTDGTPAGTDLLADLFPGMASSSPSNWTAVGSTLYFTAATSSGRELWALTLGSRARAVRH